MKEKKEILGKMWITGIYEDVNVFWLTGESRKSSLRMELNKTDLAKNVGICGHVDVSAIKVLPGTGFDMVEAPEIYELKKLLVEYVLNQNKKSQKKQNYVGKTRNDGILAKGWCRFIWTECTSSGSGFKRTRLSIC